MVNLASEIETAARALARVGPMDPTPTDLGPWSAERVGRNTVWKLTRQSGRRERGFAKFYGSTVAYRRELEGLRLADRLAEGRDWLMAATILVADESERLIVTRALPGTPLRDLVRQALRRDQARGARRAAMEALEHGLSLLRDWIGLLRDEPMPPLEILQDDRPPNVARRIAAKLDRLRAAAPAAGPRLAIPETFQPRWLEQSDESPVLIHGDLSFGNVFHHEGRIGIVDFENLGIGTAIRDRIWVRYNLEQCDFRWSYQSSGRLREILEAPGLEDRVAGLYRLEFVIDHLLILAARLRAQPWRERVLGAGERRWARREFERLQRFVAGA